MTDRKTPRPRSAYREFHLLETRWRDNDQFGHVYNATYYELFDEGMNRALLSRGMLDHGDDAPLPVVVENGCGYFTEVSYPDRLEIGIVLTHLGGSSFRLEMGMFREGDETEAAQAHFIMVVVDAATRRPVPIPRRDRAALASLQ